jgi:hypothetical protein
MGIRISIYESDARDSTKNLMVIAVYMHHEILIAWHTGSVSFQVSEIHYNYWNLKYITFAVTFNE